MSSRNKWIIVIFSTLFTLYLIGEVVSHFFFGFSIWLFINIPLYLIPFVGAILILIFIIVDSLKNKQLKRNVFPLVLSFLLILLMINQSFSPLLRKAEFSFKLGDREDVATSILNGEIETTNERGNLFRIPKGYGSSSLSDGKEVMKMNDKLLFFTKRGVLDDFSGYIFSPNGVEPRDEEVMAKIVKKQRMSKNWYYIACT
ncbi:hypothetical protein [Sporosarcina sp. FA9]|uniref:hypothetical protein n=1 Tax=Sporosarcina sp. FA9 TaxID=3413030 RepID=UPI003F65953A